MTTFDQRNQKVNYQYNANRDINFGAIQNNADVPVELEKLLTELQKAVKAGSLKDENAIDAEAKIKKAIIQSRKPVPNKKSIIENLQEAKELLKAFTVATGLVTGLAQAVEMVTRIL